MKPTLVITGDTKYIERASLRRVGNVFVIKCYFTNTTSLYHTTSVASIETIDVVKEDGDWRWAGEARNEFAYRDCYPADGVLFDVVWNKIDGFSVGTVAVLLAHSRTTLMEVLGHKIGKYYATITIATNSFMEKLWDDNNLIESYPKE